MDWSVTAVYANGEFTVPAWTTAVFVQPGEEAISETGVVSEPEVAADTTSPEEQAAPSTGTVVALILGVMGLVVLVALWLRTRGRK